MALPKIRNIIGSVNGNQWAKRASGLIDGDIALDADLCDLYVHYASKKASTDLTGHDVYSCAVDVEDNATTRYDIVNNWQVNYARGLCTIEGALLQVCPQCYSDEELFRDLFSVHSAIPQATVLDVGCNTGEWVMEPNHAPCPLLLHLCVWMSGSVA